MRAVTFIMWGLNYNSWVIANTTVKIYDMETILYVLIRFLTFFYDLMSKFVCLLSKKVREGNKAPKSCLHVVNFDCRIRNHPYKREALGNFVV